MATYGESAAPQLGQNLPEPVTVAWHFGHARGGVGAGGAIEAPQFGQNLEVVGTGWPHFGHAIVSACGGPPGGAPPRGAPQLGQNRVPGGTSAPHFGHGVDGPWEYIPPIIPVMP